MSLFGAPSAPGNIQETEYPGTVLAMPTRAMFEHTGNMVDTESIATENTELSDFDEEMLEGERVFYEVPQGSQAGEIRNMCDDNGEEMGSQRGTGRLR
jgi:hypothetical protein